MPKLPNDELTTREKDALRHYQEHVEKYGDAPSYRQLAEYLGVYHNAARALCQGLERKGYLKARPITITRMKLTAKGRKAEP